MPEPSSPTVRRRRLAAELRKLRERAGLIGEQVAERMGWSTSKVSRIENAHSTPRPSEIRELLLLYGIDGEYAEQLVALAREANRKGWWEGYAGALPDAHTEYIGLGAEATSSCHWAPEFVPGLVQTEDYARVVITSNARAIAHVPPGEIQSRIEARMIRQKILEREPPFELDLVLDESVLLRRIGQNEVMQRQIDRLIKVSELETVTLRILPLDGPHAIITGGFTLLQFGTAREIDYHDVAYLEHLTGANNFEAEKDIPVSACVRAPGGNVPSTW
ncbi:MAG: helix-turn-helix transcriptional regulator [Streptosporangiaceae bacterium]|jgi:transcriptional regulator with XRE-family HTH domain